MEFRGLVWVFGCLDREVEICEKNYNLFNFLKNSYGYNWKKDNRNKSLQVKENILI